MNLIYGKKNKADLKGYILSIMCLVSFAVIDSLIEYIKESIKNGLSLKKITISLALLAGAASEVVKGFA